MLAPPTQSSAGGQLDFEHWRRIDKWPTSQGADLAHHPVCECLQTLAKYFVVVASQGVAGDIGEIAVGQHGRGVGCQREIVQAGDDHRSRARYQLSGLRPRGAVAGHIIHLAVVAGIEPGSETLVSVAQVGAGDAYYQTKLAAPFLDVGGQRAGILCVHTSL